MQESVCLDSYLYSQVPYFFLRLLGRVFPCETVGKTLDPSYKMNLDFWDCFGRENPISLQNFVGLIQIFGIILEIKKNFESLININTVQYPNVLKYCDT